MVTVQESYKYEFSGVELVEIARTQAQLMGEMRQAEEHFNNVKADHKATITGIEAQISKCTLRVTSGYEMRPVKCLLLKFRPDKNHALVVRTDNGRVLRVRQMEYSETQLPLPLEGPDSYQFAVDLYEDGDNGHLLNERVPITAREAEELRHAMELRPYHAGRTS